jgi:hypothetical protein
MSRVVGSVLVSNGRIAWLVASGAVVAILSLPSSADAQADRPPSVMQQRPVGPSGGGGRSGGGGGSSFDLFDYRDAIANTAVVSPGPATPGGQPLTSQDVVCLAGCDRGPGSVVYRDRPTATLASLTAPTPSLQVAPPMQVAAPQQSASTMSCIAGCYEPPPKRTVASLRDRPVQIQAPQPRVQLAARSKPAALTDTPVVAEAPRSAAEPVTRLRSAYAANDQAPTITRTAANAPVAKSRTSRALAKSKVKRGPQYGKVVPVKAPAAAPVVSRAPAVEPGPSQETQLTPSGTAAVESEAPKAEPLVTRFAPTRRPERRPVEKTRPQASVSNDWFNKINAERKARDAAEKSAN